MSIANQLLFRTRFVVLMKFSMPDGSNMDAHRIHGLGFSLCSSEFWAWGSPLP